MAEETPGAPQEVPAAQTPVHPGATLLPEGLSARPRRPVSFWVLAGVVVVLLAAAIILPLTLRGGSSAPSAPVAAARLSGKVPKTAVFAQSNTAVPADSAAVVVAARALLAGSLPAAPLSSTVRAALVHPSGAGAASLTLAPGLALDDPELPPCLATVTGGATLFGIDRIRYAGQVSLLIVTADEGSTTQADAYVIGAGCAQPGSGIRAVDSVPLG